MAGVSIAPAALPEYRYGVMLGRSRNLMPPDVCFVGYNHLFGGVDSGVDSLYNGDFPDADQTWMFPNNETKVVDSSGNIYQYIRYQKVKHVGTLPVTYLQDVEWLDDGGFVAIDDDHVVRFSKEGLPIGELGDDPIVDKLCVRVFENKLFIFAMKHLEPAGIVVHELEMSDIRALVPLSGPTGDLNELKYTPDAVFVDTDNVVYLFSRKYSSLFRWNTTSQDYISTIALYSETLFVTYDTELQHIYTVDKKGLIRMMELQGGTGAVQLQTQKAFS